MQVSQCQDEWEFNPVYVFLLSLVDCINWIILNFPLLLFPLSGQMNNRYCESKQKIQKRMLDKRRRRRRFPVDRIYISDQKVRIRNLWNHFVFFNHASFELSEFSYGQTKIPTNAEIVWLNSFSTVFIPIHFILFELLGSVVYPDFHFTEKMKAIKRLHWEGASVMKRWNFCDRIGRTEGNGKRKIYM